METKISHGPGGGPSRKAEAANALELLSRAVDLVLADSALSSGTTLGKFGGILVPDSPTLEASDCDRGLSLLSEKLFEVVRLGGNLTIFVHAQELAPCISLDLLRRADHAVRHRRLIERGEFGPEHAQEIMDVLGELKRAIVEASKHNN